MKTKKLKKLWSKYQTAQREVKDIQEEFQQERSDMLDTIRELTRQLKLKEVRLMFLLLSAADTICALCYNSNVTCSHLIFGKERHVSVKTGEGAWDIERFNGLCVGRMPFSSALTTASFVIRWRNAQPRDPAAVRAQ